MKIFLITFTLSFFLISVSQADTLTQKTKLIIGTKTAEPFVMREADGSLAGMSIEMIKNIMSDLDVKYEFKEFETIEELVNATEDSAIDLSVAAISITAEREKKMDFTQPYYITTLGIAIKEDMEKNLFSQYLNFFSTDFFWILIVLSIVLLIFGIIFWLFERKSNPEQFGGSVLHGIGSGFWYSVVTMCTVGYGDKSPRTVGGRIIATLFMIKSLVIVSSFTAAMTTSLTVGSLGNEIRSKDDLYNVKVGTIKGSSSEDFLSSNGIKYTGFNDVESGFEKLHQGKIDAFVYDKPILSYFVNNRDFRNIKLLNDSFRNQYYGIGLPRGSLLRKELNVKLLKYIRSESWSGINFRYLGEYFD